eukprot:COSAG01_NODE_29371_length_639_cov_1.362963_2_plen_31_part_00
MAAMVAAEMTETAAAAAVVVGEAVEVHRRL